MGVSKLPSPFLTRFSTTYYKAVNSSFVMKREEGQPSEKNENMNESEILKNNPIFTI